jgi:FMN phosphatase YigB (HAD superfamily)
MNHAVESYPGEIQKLKEQKEKLIQLILLTDPAVAHVEMNELSTMQWQEYVTTYPEEM